MLLVEQNAALALDLADHAYLIETGQSRHGRDRAARSDATKTFAAPISATEASNAMDLFLHQVLAGLATGGIYACMALAIVMIYQAIDNLNFAQGEMAMFSTFIAWQLMQWGMPYWVAFFATIAISFAAGVADRAGRVPAAAPRVAAQPHRRLHRAVRDPQQPCRLHLGLHHQELSQPVRHPAAVRPRPDQHA